MIRYYLLLCLVIAATSCSKYPSGPLAFVTCERSGTVEVIDISEGRVIDSIKVGNRPRGIRISENGNHAYVALSTPIGGKPKSSDNRVIVIDTSSGNVTRYLEVGTDPEQIAVDGGENFLYVSNEEAGTASVIDLKSGKIAETLITGIEPEGVTISPDGRWVYVTAETSSTISVIGTELKQIVDTLLVGSRPRDTAFSPDSKFAYVSTELGQSLTKFETETRTEIASAALGYNDQVKPVGVVISGDGAIAYVANGRANTVAVIDTEKMELIKTIPVGERVWGLGLAVKQNKLFTANGLSNDVSVIDTATNSVLQTIPVQAGPWGIAIRP